jgi:hypothetical protein
MKRAKIHIENCQIKSIEKAIIVAKCLDTLEKEIGIKETEISFKDMFICPDIDLTILANSKDPMEKILGKIFIKMDRIKYGKNSDYKKI